MTTAMTAVQSKGFPEAGSKEPDVNGLPLSMVDQWQEYPTKRSFAVSVPTGLRRQYYPDDATFGKAMREAGYTSAHPQINREAGELLAVPRNGQ